MKIGTACLLYTSLLHPEREQMPSLHDFYNNWSLQGPQAKALTMALSMYVDGTMDL